MSTSALYSSLQMEFMFKLPPHWLHFLTCSLRLTFLHHLWATGAS